MSSFIQRLQAAYDLLRGRVPKSLSTNVSPINFGVMTSPNGRRTAMRKSGVTFDKLRRFSETSIPRRFINYYRSQVAMLDWQIVPKVGQTFNQRQAKAARKLTALLERPNPDLNWNTFITQVVEELLVPGVAPIEVKTLRPRERRDINDDESIAPDHMLFPFDGSTLQYYVDWDGSPSQPRYAQVLPDGTFTDFKNYELMPWRYGARVHTPHGLSPMEVAFIDIEHFLQTGAFAGRTASNANPKKALWVKDMTVEQRREMAEYWRSEVYGSNEIPIVGGEKAESIELGLTTDGNLFLGFQAFKISVIAAAFGLDPTKANILAGVNRSTGDTMDATSDEGAIKPLADDIAQYITQYLLPLYGLGDVAEFKFVLSAISDRKALAVLHQVELQADVKTINQSRAERGEPPLKHPITDEDIGNCTLSFYRQMIKAPGFAHLGLKALENQAKTAEQQAELQRLKIDQAKNPAPANASDGEFGTNSNNTSDDPAQRGGNGVYSAPKPDEKTYNRRNDADLDMT